MTNLFDYLEANVKADQPYFDEMRKNLPLQYKGSVSYTFNRKRYYMVYQPVGVKDWAIIGIVPTNVMDAGMRQVQMFTIALLVVLSLMILGGIGKIFYDKEKTRKEKAEAERIELQRRKELTEQMFHGMPASWTGLWCVIWKMTAMNTTSAGERSCTRPRAAIWICSAGCPGSM